MTLRRSILLLAYASLTLPVPATTLTFFVQNTYLPNVSPDRWHDSGLIVASSTATATASGLCIGDIPLPPPQFQARQLFICDFRQGTLTFSFVDATRKSKPGFVDTFIMTVTFRSNTGQSANWKVSAYDLNHNLLQTQTGSTAVQSYYPRGETIMLFQPNMASVEFEAPGGTTNTSVQLVHFDITPLSMNKP